MPISDFFSKNRKGEEPRDPSSPLLLARIPAFSWKAGIQLLTAIFCGLQVIRWVNLLAPEAAVELGSIRKIEKKALLLRGVF
jgi:hypothetical protein